MVWDGKNHKRTLIFEIDGERDTGQIRGDCEKGNLKVRQKNKDRPEGEHLIKHEPNLYTNIRESRNRV